MLNSAYNSSMEDSFLKDNGPYKEQSADKSLEGLQVPSVEENLSENIVYGNPVVYRQDSKSLELCFDIIEQ